MKVSVQDGKACEKLLSIEVDENTIQKEYDEFYTSVAPKAKVPGFRPGKAPREVLALHYHKEAREEVLKSLISHSFSHAVQEKELKPLGYPNIHQVDFKDKKLSYQASIEVRPKIKLSKVDGFKVKKEVAQVSETEIHETLKQIQESAAQHQAVEDRPAQIGDFLIADYVCTVDGKELEKRQKDWIEIQEDEFLKGFSTQLIGVKAGDAREIEVTFPEKMAKAELVGKKANFKVTVHEIKKKVLPEINDELAKEAGEFKSLDELKDKIRKDMIAAREREKEVEYENALLDELIKNNKIELPARVLQKREDFLLHQAKDEFVRRGGQESNFEKEKAQILPKIQEEAKKQVHLAFLLDEIAEKENIHVGPEDLKAYYQRIADRFRQKVEDVEKYYLGHEEALETAQDQIRSEKAIEWLKKKQAK